MPNPYFRFKQFTVFHDRTAMKVTTDACLFGAWCAAEMQHLSCNTALDIGTGTGLLSLMVAQKNKLLIDVVELDASAAQQAAENVSHSLWKEHIRIYHTDVKTFEAAKKYDCIFSNPPFYESEIESEKAEKNRAHHSKGLRLGELLPLIKNLLQPDGAFFLLLPFKRKEEALRLLRKNGLHVQQLTVVQQTPAHTAFRILLQGKATPVSAVSESAMVICQAPQQYSPEFIDLLKDYYLYL